MPQVQEMARSEGPASDIVADDTGRLLDGRSVHVDEDDRDRRRTQHHDRVGRRQRHDQQAVRPVRPGEVTQVALPLLDRLDVVDDKVELAVGQDGIDAAEAFGRLRASQEHDDDADGQGPAETESSSELDSE